MKPAHSAPVRRDLCVALLLHVAAALGLAWVAGWGWTYVAQSGAAMALAVSVVGRAFVQAAPHPDFGAANRVTLVRLSLAMLLAAAVVQPIAGSPWLAWGVVGVATAAALLDALDGPLARRAGRATAFGARFDMETDAWFTLVLCLLVWQLDRAGVWVLASGLMRYAFVAAAWCWPWLARPLPASRRRQAVCVVQIVALIAALVPLVPREASGALCMAGLVLLAASFAADLWQLARGASAEGPTPRPAAGAGSDGGGDRDRVPDTGVFPRAGAWVLRFAAAGFVLNTLLTFESRLDGLGVHWSPRLSFELCMGVLALLAWVAWRGRPSRRAMWGLAAAWTALAVVRYVDVTVPALFGRPVNLYWDAPHAWQLAVLAWTTLSPALVLGAVAGGMLALAAIALVLRWAVEVLAECLRARSARPWVAIAGALLGASFVAYPFVVADTRWFFSLPVTPTLARQVHLLGQALSRDRTEARLTASPSFAANVEGLHGADVLVLFAESYGVATLDRPAQADALAAPRERLAEALRRGGRQVVSARVRSPTFGGASWLAHAALLSGVDTRDPNDYDLLLTTRRPTLVSHFAGQGYRTVGWMPGMQRPWPEGAFYGFERYADAKGVGYAGPIFGYWGIPDQASIALLQAQELDARAKVAAAAGDVAASAAARPPRFIVFPTLETHAPFIPLPPYQPHWDRLLTAEAYTTAEVAEAIAPAEPPGGWGPAYVHAIAQTFQWLGDFLADRAPMNLLTVVLGDHQPLAAVSGAGASWDVPVHIISNDEALLQRLRDAGFVSGLVPGPGTLCAMHELTPLLVRAFDVPRVDVAGAAAGRKRRE